MPIPFPEGCLNICSTGQSYGPYAEKHLQTTSRAVKDMLSAFCIEKGFTPDWKEIHTDGNQVNYRMTKHPLLMLYWLAKQQPNNHIRHQFHGAWRINMSPSCIAVNVIVNTFFQQDTLTMNKFTLFYPNVPQQQMHHSLNYPSFRTSIFNGNIYESRCLLQQITFPGMQINVEEDTIYPEPHLSSHEKAQTLQHFVHYMKQEHMEQLKSSYSGSHETALEEEFALLQQCDVIECIPSAKDIMYPPPRKLSLSVIVDNHFQTKTAEPYPSSCTEIISKTWGTIVAQHPHATLVSSVSEYPDSILHTFHSVDGAIPLHYHNAYIKFIPIDGTQKQKWCCIQCTARGGLRLVFLLDIPHQATTYVSPTNGEPLPLPSAFVDHQSQHVNWCWCDEVHVPHHSYQYLKWYRDIQPSQWIPYPKDVSAQIENAYQQQASSCSVGVGPVSLDFHFGGHSLHSREAGVQCNKQRQHFIKRMLITDTEHRQTKDTYNHALKEMQKHASGEKEHCVICLESLKNNKCTLTSCGHLFHSLCLQAHVNATHKNECPCCRGALQHASTLPCSTSLPVGRY